MNQDLYNMINGKLAVVPAAAKTAAVTGSGVDLAGYEGANIFVNVGVRTDSNFQMVLKESDDNSTYSAVADGDVIGTQPLVSGISNTAYQFGYKGTKRYIRPDFTFKAGGASAGAFLSVLVVRGFKRHEPAV
jgi:hypothetical protein